MVYFKSDDVTLYSYSEESTDIDGQPGPRFPGAYYLRGRGAACDMSRCGSPEKNGQGSNAGRGCKNDAADQREIDQAGNPAPVADEIRAG